MNTQTLPFDTYAFKRERVELRVPQTLKTLLQYAADLQGRSLSDFLATTAEKAANEVIRDHQVLQLSVTDSIALANALLDAPQPNKALHSAYKTYTKKVSSHK